MSLYKRDDIYWMDFRINGKRDRISTGTSNRKLAERIHAKKALEIAEGKYFQRNEPVEITLDELMEKYMTEISPGLAESTHYRNGQIVKSLKADIGAYLLKDATPSVISAYKARKLQEGYRKETILRELGLLRRIFNIAIEEWELCSENPVRKVLRSLGKADNKRVRYLTPEESDRLMLALPSWLRSIVIVARNTGLRKGNILGLTWQQVNFQKKILIVERTKNGEPIGIPLTDIAVRTLAERQRIRHLTSPYVFCDGIGGAYSPHQVSSAFKRACKRAGIENLRFHDLRHDFASNLVQLGVDIYTVKDLLGHKDLRMTQRYCHLAPENLRSAINLLNQRLNGHVLVTIGEKQKGLLNATP